MRCFVIVEKGKEFLEAPVFHAGQDDKEEAIAVFTEKRLANKYIDDAGWQDDYEVGALKPIQMLRWLTVANEQEIDVVAIDPDRCSQLEGKQQRVVDLSESLENFASTYLAKLLVASE